MVSRRLSIKICAKTPKAFRRACAGSPPAQLRRRPGHGIGDVPLQDVHGRGEHDVDGVIEILHIAPADVPVLPLGPQAGDPVNHAGGAVHVPVQLLPQLEGHAALEGGVAVRLPAVEIVEVGDEDVAVPHVPLLPVEDVVGPGVGGLIGAGVGLDGPGIRLGGGDVVKASQIHIPVHGGRVLGFDNVGRGNSRTLFRISR